ncbi:MAG: hypothetical protein KF770_27395, partial [Anaerolineae bacterium]|nr:hypothetical protein [Anaerolineae bacterium]
HERLPPFSSQENRQMMRIAARQSGLIDRKNRLGYTLRQPSEKYSSAKYWEITWQPAGLCLYHLWGSTFW